MILSSPSASTPWPGLFVSFEGIDGAGKSTHITHLAQAWANRGAEVVLTREPGGTPLSEQLRALVLHETMDPLTEALLVFAARRDHINTVIAPALERGAVVLCDRFTDATFAYQGGGRGFDLGVLGTLEQWVQTWPLASQLHSGVPQVLLQPDITLWFDVPVEVAAARLSQARAPDRFEAEPGAFFTRVRDGYLRRHTEQPGRVIRLDAEQSVSAVWGDIEQLFHDRAWWGRVTRDGVPGP
jgi:dTMP kinase